MRQRKAQQEALRKKLGKALVQARRRRKWTQSELARRLEMSRDRLGKWERGVHIPSLEDVVLLSEVLGIPFWELGLGDAPAEGISTVELFELARSFSTISRLLKPWLSRLPPELVRNAKSNQKGLPAS